jgi:hypothetical protein
MMRAEDATAENMEPSQLLRLPCHVLREVFGFLDAKDVARAATTCSTLREVNRSESLGRRMFESKLGTQAEIVLPRALPDERYVARTRHSRRQFAPRVFP